MRNGPAMQHMANGRGELGRTPAGPKYDPQGDSMLDPVPLIHTLAGGATLISTSPGHAMRFSDGTTCSPQHQAVADRLTCQRQERIVRQIAGMDCVEIRMILAPEQLDYLESLCDMADLVLVPFPVLTALREQGMRDRFPNVVAGNSTPATMRSPPAEKVWDVTRWSW
jgi:hypothetical protein